MTAREVFQGAVKALDYSPEVRAERLAAMANRELAGELGSLVNILLTMRAVSLCAVEQAYFDDLVRYLREGGADEAAA